MLHLVTEVDIALEGSSVVVRFCFKARFSFSFVIFREKQCEWVGGRGTEGERQASFLIKNF